MVSLPFSNGIQYIGMNVTKPPFDNPKVRQAIAYAIPYQKIIDAVLFGLANPMFGAPAAKTTEVAWPQPTKFNTDMEKAKALLAEAGYANGFETTLSFDLNFAGVNEPLCILLQESLGQIGIKTTINKIPGANWRTELTKKELPLYTNVFSGWLDYPEYFFYWCYHGNNSIFNTMSYKSPEMDNLIDGARTAASTGDTATYDKDVKGFVDLAFTDVPRIPLYQPFVNVAMQKNISGYQYWFHRRLDYRALVKAVSPDALHDRQAADVRDPEPDRGRDRHLPADARAARRSRGLFRRPRRHQGGGRADQEEARLRQAAGRAVRPLHQRSRPRRFWLLVHHRPAGGDRNPQPPAGFRRTDACSACFFHCDRAAARRARRNAAGIWIDHFCRVTTTAGVSLPVFFTGLVLVYVFYFLLGWSPAPLGRLDVSTRAADRDRLLSDRHAARPRLRGVPLRAEPVVLPAATLGDLLAGADRAHDPGLDAGGAVVRLRAHRARSGLSPAP